MTMENIRTLLDKCKIAYKVNGNGIEANKVPNNKHKPVSLGFSYVEYNDDRGKCISFHIGKEYGDYEGIGTWFTPSDNDEELKRLLKKFGLDVPEVSYSQMRLF